MKNFYKIYYIYKNYNIIKNLKWTKKGIFIYIMSFIGLIKFIISHPIYKITKKIINLLIIFEGILLVIYYTELPIDNMSITFTTIYIFIQEFYIKILKFIRDKLDYLLEDAKFEENNQSKDVNPNENNTSNNSNKSFYWMIGISIVIISSTIAIYYYYPNILDYFNNKDKGDTPPEKPSNFKNSNNNQNIIDSPNSPISIIPDPDATSKSSSSNLPPVVD